MSDSVYMELVNKCWMVECVTNSGVFNRSDLPGTTSLRLEQLGAAFESGSVSDSPSWDGFSQDCGTTPEQSESDYFD